MIEATVCCLMDGESVWLAAKLRTYAVGKKNPYGGKIEPGQSIRTSASEETEKECGVRISPEQWVDVAVVNTYHGTEQIYKLHVLVAQTDQKPKPSEEMGEPQLYHRDALPTDDMIEGTDLWLRQALHLKRFSAEVRFVGDGKKL